MAINLHCSIYQEKNTGGGLGVYCPLIKTRGAELLLLKQQSAARDMQNKGQIVPPPGHVGNISLRITLLICHFNGCSYCSRCVPSLSAGEESVCVCTAECVGVDSSVLAGALGYAEDIVSHWLWHCTTCYYLSVHQAEPRCSERGQRGRYVRPSVASLVPSLNAAATSSSWFVS